MQSIIFVIFTLFLLSKPSPIVAAATFSDSFSGGYDQTLWTVWQNMTSPIPSSFGIGDTNTGDFYVLASTVSSLPTNNIIKFDMKINTNPSAVWFSCNDSNDSTNERRVALRSDGTFTFEVFLNGGGLGSNFMNWDNTAGIHNFEFTCLGGSLVLKEDNITIGSWTHTSTFIPEKVRFFYKDGDSEFANYKLCDSNGCDSFPTSTPTPTNTPTPTPSTTPTPQQPKKVILIPGAGGSWNKDAILNCKPDGYSGNWTSWKKSDEVYQSLLQSLQQNNYTPVPFYYDWRKQVTNTGSMLTSFIQNNTASEEKVDIVGHSLGGLVGRAYLEEQQTGSRLEKLLTVGSPHQGVVFAYPLWSGGQIMMGNINFRLALTALEIGCRIRYGWSPREAVNNVFPSIQNVLPTFDYLKDKNLGTLKPTSSLYAQNNWQPTSFSPPFFGVTVGTLAGIDQRTLRFLEVEPPNRLEQRLGNWLDGKPKQQEENNDGDGTVLLQSSQLLGADNRTLPLGHLQLVSDQLGISEIIDFLSESQGITSSSSLLEVTLPARKEKTSALLIILDGTKAIIKDKKGNQISDSEGQITIIEPGDDTYELMINPKSFSHKIIVAQLFEDGTSTWKEYSRKGIFSKLYKLRFDGLQRNSDILRD